MLHPAHLAPQRLMQSVLDELHAAPTPPPCAFELDALSNIANWVKASLPESFVMPKKTMQALERLGAEKQTVDLFFRDDDVDEDEATLWQLLNTFLFRGVPINLEVIPGKLKAATVRLLLQQQQAYPALIELNQHGWMHTNHEVEGRKCEFGASREFTEQYADIARGKAVLDEAFGHQWHPVFTPPWNRCTADTLQALHKLGFRVFSKDRSKEPVAGYGFTEISTTLDLYRWQPRATMKSPSEIERELIAQLRPGEPIGILLHHKVMDAAAFSFLASLLDELRRFPVVRFHTFASLLADRTLARQTA